MAYTFLDNSLNTIGVLTNKGGQTNDYWGDSITHEIATSQDVLTSVSLSVDKPSVNIDTSGNQKTWNHVIQGLSFNIDGIGRKVNENDYLIYQEGTNGKYYLMAITQVDESAVQSGFHYKTVQGLNAAAYDLSRKTLRAKSFAQIPDNTQEKGTAQNILRYIFKDINWDVRIIGSFGAIDYEITEGTTAQAVLLDIIGMFEAEVDAYVQLNNWGKGANVFNKNGSVKRIFDFSTSLGKYRGETIRYDKNMVSITKTGARDSMYTKLYVNGNNITIADANKGADFIVDDVANRKYNKLGAVSTPVTYLEGIISNSAIESPTALLAWGKKQLKILNHPRYNYQISATNDDKVQLGDTVIIQDTHASDPIYLKSKVISKTISLADPVNNSFIVGEFSPIVIGADNGLDDTDQIMQLVNQANQTAVNAQNKANENAQKIVDTRTNLEKTIDDKLTEGKDYADSLNSKAIEEQTKFNNQINQELATAKSERDALSSKADQMLVSANSYADDMYNNAVAVAKDEASKALSDANTSLDEAKTDLTDGLNKEIADRGKAVSVVNSQAQDYATQAKADAIAAANTADGQVRKDFKVTTDALSSTISQNKEDADGKISTAQTIATQALNGLSTKVSQTDYDKKTGDLSTAVNTVTQTANETKDELASVSQTVDSQSAQINTISNTVDGTTQTISDIQTVQDKQSGSINKLETRADGFDASITKINDFVNSQGQINQLMNTEFNPDLEGWDLTIDGGNSRLPYRSYMSKDINATVVGFDTTKGEANSWSNLSQKVQLASTALANTTISLSWSSWAREVANYNGLHVFFYDNKDNKVGDAYKEWTAKPGDGTNNSYAVRRKFENISVPDTATYAILKFQAREGTGAYLAQPMMVWGSTVGDYVQGNYNNNGALAKVKLTADKATLDLSNYQKDADGRISQAQSDITATANAVSTKVSQSDYDKKTQDLDTKYGQVKATADAVTTDVASYKSTNDKKVNANTASIQTLNNQITSKVSQIDFDKKTGELSGNYTETKQTVDKISQSVTELQAKANAQGQINQLANTEFKPDYSGWTIDEPRGTHRNKLNMAYKGSTIFEYDSRTSGGIANSGSVWLRSDEIPINYGSPLSMSVVARTVFAPTDETTGYFTVQPRFTLNDGSVKFGDKVVSFYATDNNTDWIYSKSENIQVPANTVSVCLYSWIRGAGVVVRLAQPMLVFDNKIGDYVAGNYNNNSRVSALEVSLNGITGTVNDPKNGLSATAKLASDGMTIATKAQNDASSALITANGVQTKVKQMGGINLLVNTEFNPDLEGWDLTIDGGNSKLPYRSYMSKDINATVVGFDTTKGEANSWSNLSQKVQLASTALANTTISLSWSSWAREVANYNGLHVFFYDNKDNKVGDAYKEWTAKPGDGTNNSHAVRRKFENISVPDTATYAIIKFQAREGTGAYLAQPMMVWGSTIGEYVPGNYNNNNSLESTRTQLAGQVTTEIEDRKSGDKSVVTQMTKLIDQRLIDTEKGYESAISQSADNIMLSVSTPNSVVNSEFENDLNSNNDGSGIDGWTIQNPSTGTGNPAIIMNSDGYKNSNGLRINAYTNNAETANAYYNIMQTIKVPKYVTNASFNMMGYVYAASTEATTYININIEAKDVNNKRVGWIAPSGNLFDWSKTGVWQEANGRLTNMTIPAGTDTLILNFYIRGRASVNFSQPVLTFTSKKPDYIRGPKNNLTTNSVLGLFDDRFALGIKNNTGNIISGINGDSSGLSIVGKKIVVSGDTTFLGNNFMDGAVIKNASISSAKIDSLDVDKLTGNTAQFVSTKWDSQHSNVTINGDGFHITTNGVDTTLDNTGIHLNDNKNSTSSTYDFSNWYDSSGHTTSAFGLNLGVKNSGNGFLNFKGTSGASIMLYAGVNMQYGSNKNIEKGALNIFTKTIVPGSLFFDPNTNYRSIQINGNNGSFNFRTGGSTVANGNYFWFNHNVSVSGTISGASQLSKKNVKRDYDEDALSEISKTRLVEFEYKNNVGETHISPIIDDINPDKQFYIPETIINPTREFVDLYSMISMSWKAIQQINEKMEKNNDIKE